MKTKCPSPDGNRRFDEVKRHPVVPSRPKRREGQQI